MTTKKWFVVLEEVEMGPLGPNGLRKLVSTGEVQADTLVRREDHQFVVRADHVRGLFEMQTEHAHKHAKMHGPFTSLRTLGRFNAAMMAIWVLVGVFGVITAWNQRQTAIAIAGGADQPLLDAGAPFLGLGGVVVAALFLATGVPFTYWLWCARINLPHLINARIRFAPSWVIACWFVPILNLLRPYQVIDEIDRRSAEADADGDATVQAARSLLVPWWVCTLLLVAAAAAYKLVPVGTAEEIAAAALLHLCAAIAVVMAAGLAIAVVLRISSEQERAHDSHAGPVQPHYKLKRNQDNSATA